MLEGIRQLRQLADDFQTLHDRVQDISYTPGTDVLHRVGPLLLSAQDLTTTALARLQALDNSSYTNIAGSRASLELMASVVSSSALAGTELAHVLLANPWEGQGFAGYPPDSAAIKRTRHAEAIPQMTGHLTDAAHQLDLCATACRYLASGITDDYATSEPTASATQQTVPSLSAPQYDALAALAKGGRLFESAARGMGVTRVAADDGTRISIATFRALNNRGLVNRDTSTPLLTGQEVTVTEQGRRALTQPRPSSSPPTTAAVKVPPATPVQGVRR